MNLVYPIIRSEFWFPLTAIENYFMEEIKKTLKKNNKPWRI